MRIDPLFPPMSLVLGVYQKSGQQYQLKYFKDRIILINQQYWLLESKRNYCSSYKVRISKHSTTVCIKWKHYPMGWFNLRHRTIPNYI